MNHSVAFALGGLGGMNAHGVGFLAAAQETTRRHHAVADTGSRDGYLPSSKFISCSSGMIHWTARYLEHGDLKSELATSIEEVTSRAGLPRGELFEPLVSPVVALFSGLPGVFRPWAESYLRHLTERVAGFLNPSSPTFLLVPGSWAEWWDLLFPARLLIPERGKEFYDHLSEVFNQAPLGIAFNSFNLTTGEEYLHVNEVGLGHIRAHRREGVAYEARHRGTVYKPITPDYVKAALWLYEYGFDESLQGEHLVDGAYRRQIILNEVTLAERIYVPRPLNRRWLGRQPKNFFEREDLKIEMWFGASYEEQARMIRKINDWTGPDDGADGDSDYRLQRIDPAARELRPIDLVEIPIELQRGYFDYFIESMAVFTRAYQTSLERLLEREMPDPPVASGSARTNDG